MENNKEQLIKKMKKARLKAWVTSGSSLDNYGFGSNWHLIIGRKNVPEKSFWLGQGAKVTKRMLGVNYGDYVKDVTERRAKINPYKRSGQSRFPSEKEWLLNKKINKIITGDIINAVGIEDTSSKALKKLLKAESWELAVQ